MLIENYKGIDINHDASKDEFTTNIIILKGTGGKKDEYIKNGRLQKVRDDIDKFLNTAGEKPVLQKCWTRRYDNDLFKLANIIIFNKISNQAIIQIENDSNLLTVKMGTGYYNNSDHKAWIQCEENDSIIDNLNSKREEINKINKEVSCSSGKLIPLSPDHFKPNTK